MSLSFDNIYGIAGATGCEGPMTAELGAPIGAPPASEPFAVMQPQTTAPFGIDQNDVTSGSQNENRAHGSHGHHGRHGHHEHHASANNGSTFGGFTANGLSDRG